MKIRNGKDPIEVLNVIKVVTPWPPEPAALALDAPAPVTSDLLTFALAALAVGEHGCSGAFRVGL